VRSACDGINYSVIGTAFFTAFLKRPRTSICPSSAL
jgi:hypothetical protein